MTGTPSSGTLVTVLPCNLDASERFYNRLGFVRRVESGDPDYRILSNSAGGHLNLTKAEKGWLVLTVFVALVVVGSFLFSPNAKLGAYLAYVAVLCVLLVGTCWLKGEPLRWRWGNDERA